MTNILQKPGVGGIRRALKQLSFELQYDSHELLMYRRTQVPVRVVVRIYVQGPHLLYAKVQEPLDLEYLTVASSRRYFRNAAGLYEALAEAQAEVVASALLDRALVPRGWPLGRGQ